MKYFTIYAFAHNPWEAPWMNRQQILSRLGGKGHNVVYSNGPFMVWDRNSEKMTQAPWKAGWEVKDNVKVINSGKFPFRWPRFRKLDRYVIKRHLDIMRKAANHFNSINSNEILFVFNPSFYPYVKESTAKNIVYYVYDAYSLSKHWNDKVAEKEKKLVSEASIIYTVTQQMADLLPQQAHKKMNIIPNGADVSLFSTGCCQPCPGDLGLVPRPRIGYVGNITPKVDLNLVAEIANIRPEWHWVFIGRFLLQSKNQWKDEYSRIGFEKCNQLKNVHFLGEKTLSELPAYMGHMDINTMCYRSKGKGWWVAGYPLKLHEYLAVGKPVVSADIEAVRPFSHVCDIAEFCEDWIAAIERGFHGGIGTEVLRRQVASENSWDKRVDEIEKILYQTF